jgi:hypothetical protein
MTFLDLLKQIREKRQILASNGIDAIGVRKDGQATIYEIKQNGKRSKVRTEHIDLFEYDYDRSSSCVSIFAMEEPIVVTTFDGWRIIK